MNQKILLDVIGKLLFMTKLFELEITDKNESLTWLLNNNNEKIEWKWILVDVYKIDKI